MSLKLSFPRQRNIGVWLNRHFRYATVRESARAYGTNGIGLKWYRSRSLMMSKIRSEECDRLALRMLGGRWLYVTPETASICGDVLNLSLGILTESTHTV
jgi:hypothetical protein